VILYGSAVVEAILAPVVEVAAGTGTADPDVLAVLLALTPLLPERILLAKSLKNFGAAFRVAVIPAFF
jgi:hypothetical protein